MMGSKSDMKKISFVEISALGNQMMIETFDELPIGVPIQVQFEIIPHAPVGYTINDDESLATTQYSARIMSIKARIKPSIVAFQESEEKNLNHIIEGTEDEVLVSKRAKKRAKEIEKENNRFTGLEIS